MPRDRKVVRVRWAAVEVLWERTSMSERERSMTDDGRLSLGMRTVTVPHGPDGSVLRLPYPGRSRVVGTICTDGGRDGISPSIPVHSTSVTAVRTVRRG